MRRIDVWVGRAAAMVGLMYVLLASLWPLAASGATPDGATAASTAVVALPVATLVDVRLVKVIADVGDASDERLRTRRVVATTMIASTPESWAMLLVAALVFVAAVVATTMRPVITARNACRRNLAAAA